VDVIARRSERSNGGQGRALVPVCNQYAWQWPFSRLAGFFRIYGSAAGSFQ
jgi:hypothetical protein